MKVLNGTENEAPVEEFRKFCQGLKSKCCQKSNIFNILWQAAQKSIPLIFLC